MNSEERLALKNNNNESLPSRAFAGSEDFFFSSAAAGSQRHGGAPPPSPGGLKLNDVLFAFFRHKWKVALCTLLGVIATVAAYFLLPPKYESQAKLLVRYVVDRSAVDHIDSQNNAGTSPTASAINAEVEILTSSDLASAVVAKIGAARILGDHRKEAPSGALALSEEELAARAIVKDLEVKAVPNSNIIFVTYRNTTPALTRTVLEELLKDYFDKHMEVHRSLGTYDYVKKEAAALEKQLLKTGEELKVLKAKAGITSLAEDTITLATQISKTQEELDRAQGELAAQRAKVGQMQRLGVAADAEAKKTPVNAVPPSAEIIGQYKALIISIEKLREEETALLSRFTPSNHFVKAKQDLIAADEAKQKFLETHYPALLAVEIDTKGVNGATPHLDPIAESAQLSGLETRVATLIPRLAALQERSALLADLTPQISILQEKFKTDQENYKYYGASLEKAQLDERLDPSRIPNISVVAAPSPPDRAKNDFRKVAPVLTALGLFLGLVWAFVIEKVFDRTVKRAGEMEERLRIPLLMTIPRLTPGAGRARLRYWESEGEGNDSFAEEGEATAGALLRPFCEAIRDELGFFFEMSQMRHKPKLVAVTGLNRNAGVSSLAAGLAEALGEVAGIKKVCLVNRMSGAGRFYASLEEFRQSDLEYVIFDMPPVSETSPTAPLVGFMDKALLVVEAGKNTQAAIKRVYAKLAAKVPTSVILNKRRSCGPRWLEAEV